ncbi:MAG: N-acetyl-gamma-glutamyl-phosphate reductase [Polyangiaceae bacterium]|nr:N-acetyl-gamma-glutamyl-phosphate reductase [Polyangiaceae bacterium]
MGTLRAAVFGGSGYAGAELIRLLLIHPQISLGTVYSGDRIGEPLSAAHPNLEGLTHAKFQALPAELADLDADVCLLGLPHDVSAQVVRALSGHAAKIIDMSGAYRLHDVGAYEHHYGEPHPAPDLVPKFVYGLPEANADAIRASRYVASPGCFATSVELALLPLARAQRVPAEVNVLAVTGSSGSGVKPGPGTHHPYRAGNLKCYNPLRHPQAPEIAALLSTQNQSEVHVRFVPVSAPLVRGIFMTAFVRLREDITNDELARLFDDCYADARFVRVPADRLPEVVAVAGSNYAEVGWSVDPNDARLVTLFCALDNLVKGGAGQAVQNMNLMLGLNPALSLEAPGSYP